MKVFNFAYSTQNIIIADDNYEDFSDEGPYCTMSTISDNVNLLSAHQINIPELYNQELNEKFYNCKFFRYSNNIFCGYVETEAGDEHLARLSINEGIDGDKPTVSLNFTIILHSF